MLDINNISLFSMKLMFYNNFRAFFLLIPVKIIDFRNSNIGKVYRNH